MYATLLEEGRREEAGRFAGAVLGLVTVAAFGVALVGIAIAPILIPLVFPEFSPEQQELTVHIIRILFLMTAILVVSAWALGVLNSHRLFFISYVAPVFWNVGMIGTLVVCGFFLSGWNQEQLIVALAWGAVGGAIMQLAVQLPWVIRSLDHFKLSFDRTVTGVRDAIQAIGPVIAARGVVNISALVDVFLAGLLAAGALSMIGYAQVLYLLPISLFGMSVAAAELPELSKGGARDPEALAPAVRSALERLAFVLIPSVLAYLVLGDLFISALFERGEMGADDRTVIYAILAAYTLGILASATSRTLSSSFYALRDTVTPARIAYLRAGISVVVGAALMFPLDRIALGTDADALRFGAVGLALGSAVGAWIEYLLLRRALTRKLGAHGPGAGRMAKLFFAGLVASGVGVGAKVLLGSLVPLRSGWVEMAIDPGSWLYSPVLAVGTAGTFGVAYLATASALGVGTDLAALIRSRAR